MKKLIILFSMVLGCCAGCGQISDTIQKLEYGEDHITITPVGPPINTVYGVAAAGSALSGTVYLKDSSEKPVERQTNIGPDGNYSIDKSNLVMPVIIKAVGTVKGATYTLYSIADGNSVANINPMSTLVVNLASGGADLTSLYASPSAQKLTAIAGNLTAALNDVKITLNPLLSEYHALNVNPITDIYTADYQGLDGLHEMTRIICDNTNNTIKITNPRTNEIIFTSSTQDFKKGTVDRDKIPVTASLRLFPTTNGSNWTYSNGVTTSITRGGVAPQLTLVSGGTLDMLWKDDKLYVTALTSNDPNAAFNINTPPGIQRFPPNLVPGATLNKTAYINATDTIESTLSVETIEPVGIFPYAIKVNLSLTKKYRDNYGLPVTKISLSGSEWYAPGFGIVKQTTKQGTVDLLKYYIAP